MSEQETQVINASEVGTVDLGLPVGSTQVTPVQTGTSTDTSEVPAQADESTTSGPEVSPVATPVVEAPAPAPATEVMAPAAQTSTQVETPTPAAPVFPTADDEKIIVETVRSGFGADRLWAYFSRKYADIKIHHIQSHMRRLGVAGLRSGMGDPDQILPTT